MRLEILRRCRGFFPHLFDGERLWASRGAGVYTSRDLGRTWERQASLYGDHRRVLARLRPLDRVADRGAFNLVRLGSGDLVAAAGGALRWLPAGERVFRELPGSPVDYRPLRRGLGVDRGGLLRVADYRDNHGEDPGEETRESVTIHRCLDPAAGRWEALHTFGPGRVRHVHAVLDDPFVPDQTWVCTGDTDAESAISRSTDGLRSLRPFSAEGQRSRAVDLLFTPEHVFWGVDSPLQQSGIARQARAGGRIEWLRDTPCPVYYGATNEEGHLLFSTCVEPGPAVRSDSTEIYASRDGIDFRRVFSLRSDPLPQYAVIHFPAGVAPGDRVVFYCRATWRWENSLVVARLL